MTRIDIDDGRYIEVGAPSKVGRVWFILRGPASGIKATESLTVKQARQIADALLEMAVQAEEGS